MNVRTHILCSTTFFPLENRVFMTYMGKYGKIRQTAADSIIRRLRFALWITKATDTQSEYVILIAFALQQWLNKSVSVLRCT